MHTLILLSMLRPTLPLFEQLRAGKFPLQLAPTQGTWALVPSSKSREELDSPSKPECRQNAWFD